jgi:hypothetical protein
MKPSGQPQIITAWYQFILYLIPLVAKFPQNYRYRIGERLESLSFEILEELIEAAYTHEKSVRLERINLKIECLRYYVRLSHDLKLNDSKKYEILSRHIVERRAPIGGMA